MCPKLFSWAKRSGRSRGPLLARVALNTINYSIEATIALKQQPALNCFAATETTISDHKRHIF